jgi:Phospholipase_D-nuclease N-terminal/Short C-terminal domain
MVLVATSYPFLDILWTTLIFFAWILFIWIAVTVLVDVFRRHDLSGWAKAGWVVLVVVLPWLGVLTYLIFNHDGMNERRATEARAAQSQFDDYVRKTAAAGGPAGEIDTAKKLLDAGTITQAEFDTIKAKALV